MEIKYLTLQNDGMYEVSLTDGQKLMLHEETVVKLQLLPGKSVDSELLSHIETQKNIDQAYIRALKYISYKLRSSHEISQYLDEDFEPDIIAEVKERLMTEGYIDDARYAEASMQTMFKTTIKGPNELKRTLQKHKINPEIIEKYVMQFDNLIDSERMNYLKDKALKRHKGSLRLFQQKLRATLFEKGYSSHHLEMIRFDEQWDTFNEVDNLERDYEKSYNKYQKKFRGYDLKMRILQALARKGYPYDFIQEHLGGKLNEFEHDDSF